MLAVQKPFAVFVEFASEHGVKESRLEYIKDGESVEDTLYRLAEACNRFGRNNGVSIWLNDHHTVYAPDELGKKV